jgi:uncharacterized protein YndB with AHSA1/START domain
MQLEAKVDIAIARPPDEVFEAIVDPTKMSRYFISRASGRPEPGETITWYWDDVGARARVRILELVPDRRLVFIWGPTGQETRVTLEVAPDRPGCSAVTATEGTWLSDDAGVATFGGQIEGWTSVLFCLKASVEHGINLRTGGITRRKMQMIAARPASSDSTDDADALGSDDHAENGVERERPTVEAQRAQPDVVLRENPTV